MSREMGTDHPPYAKAKKTKSLTIHTHSNLDCFMHVRLHYMTTLIDTNVYYDSLVFNLVQPYMGL